MCNPDDAYVQLLNLLGESLMGRAGIGLVVSYWGVTVYVISKNKLQFAVSVTISTGYDKKYLLTNRRN